MIIFTRTIRVGGVLTNADALPLIVITRLSDNVVVQTSTAMTLASTGKYTFSYTGTPGITYRAAYSCIVNGAPINSSSDQIEGVVTPTSVFFTYAEFVRKWGLKNIAKASNKENNSTTPDLDAVQDSFNLATGEIYSAMDGMYIVPLDWTDTSGVVDVVVKRWAMILAWSDLYEARGFDEVSKSNAKNRITKLFDQVETEMGLVRVGIRTIGALRSREDDSGTFPDAGGSAIMTQQCYSSRTAHYLGQILVY